MAASIRRWTVDSSISALSARVKVKASASRGRGDGVRLREDFRIRSRAMSRSPPGGSSKNACGASDVLVSWRVDGLLALAASGVAGVVSGAGGVGVGAGVFALLQKNDM